MNKINSEICNRETGEKQNNKLINMESFLSLKETKIKNQNFQVYLFSWNKICANFCITLFPFSHFSHLKGSPLNTQVNMKWSIHYRNTGKLSRSKLPIRGKDSKKRKRKLEKSKDIHKESEKKSKPHWELSLSMNQLYQLVNIIYFCLLCSSSLLASNIFIKYSDKKDSPRFRELLNFR